MSKKAENITTVKSSFLFPILISIIVSIYSFNYRVKIVIKIELTKRNNKKKIINKLD